MKERYKGIIFFLILIVIVTLILGINFVKSNGNHEENTIKCIAEKSKLFVSKTCGHCAAQKEILGEDIKYFDIIDCTSEHEKCAENGILYVPTWIIDDEKYTGKKSLSQLKELANC